MSVRGRDDTKAPQSLTSHVVYSRFLESSYATEIHVCDIVRPRDRVSLVVPRNLDFMVRIIEVDLAPRNYRQRYRKLGTYYT